MNQLPIFDRVVEHGDRIAVRTADDSHSYNALLRRSESVAAVLLAERDDLHDSHVAYLVPAGFDYIAVQWGIWRAGGVAVPLSLSATEQELEYALSDSQADCVVTTTKLAAKFSALRQQLNIKLLVVDNIAESSRALPVIHPDRPAMMLYTSGTTNKPKGVVTTHACIQAQIESLIQAWHWQADDRIPLFLPLHHVHGIVNIMLCALWSGARIEPFARFDIDAICQRVADGAYTLFMAVPTIYVNLIEKLESMTAERRAAVVDGFAGMRLMISGSAALPASVHQQWTELTGQKLLERYGMTEIGMALSNPYDGERRPGAVGQPLPGVQIRLVSDHDEVIDQPNVSGEIQVRGPTVFLEYWNRPEATKESFQDGWFRTGDIAIVEQGYYRIIGRSSVDIIKSGGYKLSALEIEAALLDHPAISQCAVVGLPDPKWGEAVAAAVVLNIGQRLELESIRSWCKDRVSSYKIPRQMLVVDSLPRNAMGKVTKPDVVKLFASN